MDVREAYDHLNSALTTDVGSFFSSGANLSLGVGKICVGIRFPVYLRDSNIFATATGCGYTLTHECDIAAENQRIYSDKVLLCPLIDFAHFVEEYSGTLETSKLMSFLSALGRGSVSRVIYLPPLSQVFEYGALLYLNDIASTDRVAFDLPGAEAVGAVTAYGLRTIDFFLQNHFLREKAERLYLET